MPPTNAGKAAPDSPGNGPPLKLSSLGGVDIQASKPPQAKRQGKKRGGRASRQKGDFERAIVRLLQDHGRGRGRPGPAAKNLKGKKESMPGIITAGRVRQLLHYDPDTGVFTRRVSTSSNARAGDVAGRVNSQDYWRRVASMVARFIRAGRVPTAP
jgi:hypothetical protein